MRLSDFDKTETFFDYLFISLMSCHCVVLRMKNMRELMNTTAQTRWILSMDALQDVKYLILLWRQSCASSPLLQLLCCLQVNTEERPYVTLSSPELSKQHFLTIVSLILSFIYLEDKAKISRPSLRVCCRRCTWSHGLPPKKALH